MLPEVKISQYLSQCSLESLNYIKCRNKERKKSAKILCINQTRPFTIIFLQNPAQCQLIILSSKSCTKCLYQFSISTKNSAGSEPQQPQSKKKQFCSFTALLITHNALLNTVDSQPCFHPNTPRDTTLSFNNSGFTRF